MAANVARNLAIETQLRQALEREEFVLHYQPVVDIKSGRIISTEALLRWQHPEQGLLHPSAYLSVLEETGLIRPLTQWILAQANEQYERYEDIGFGNVRMSINLSGLLIRSDAIMGLLLEIIQKEKMDPRGLIVEITEDALTEDLQRAHAALTTLQEMGIRIALDDFGTGQSSLNHLRKNPIDIVKIDRDFVRDIPHNQHDSELVDAIIAMAHRLHIQVIAEGVETQEQLDYLRWHHCDAIQGFLFSPPLESQQVLDLLGEDRRMSG
jgi:EAL domain-containing protein (putative c-di-GMP-specific phosphodiesterase class I)